MRAVAAGLIATFLVSCGPTPPAPTVTVRAPGVAEALAKLEPHARAVMDDLAASPNSYLVKAYDIDTPTDYHADYPWHTLSKERAVRWPYGDRLGLVNAHTGLVFTLAFSLDGGPYQQAPRRVILHVIDAIAEEVDLGEGLRAVVTFAPSDSATLTAHLELRNRGGKRRRVGVEQLVFREYPAGDKGNPWRWPGSIKVVVGTRALKQARIEPDGTALLFDEHEDMFRELRGKPFGTLLAWLTADRPAVERQAFKPDTDGYAALRASLGLGDEILYLQRERYLLDVDGGGDASLSLALALYRYAPQPLRGIRGAMPYAAGDDASALSVARQRAAAALAVDWRARLEASMRAYADFPVYRVPEPRWDGTLLNCLQLPRGNTLSPAINLKTPFYTFCRAFGKEWRLWSSYGMHGHEHLSIATTVAVAPRLAMDHLRGHFALQEQDGFIPYGANPISAVGKRVFMIQGATPPFISLEAWLAYLWSGDKQWLAEAYPVLAKYHRYWLTYRDRTGEGLACWLDNGETVRDNGRVPTWHWPGVPVFFQEALDLNCYLARQERVLAEMAEELGRGDEAAAYREAFAARARAINHYLWDAVDKMYYGACEAGDLIVEQPPQDPRMLPTYRLRPYQEGDPIADALVKTIDIGTLMPFYGGIAPVDRALRLLELLKDPKVFAAPYPIPVLAMNDPSFREGGDAANWNYASWVEMNYLVGLGLRDYGLFDEAALLAWQSGRLGLNEVIRTAHFNEFFDPFTGEGLGLYEYIWACLPEAMLRDAVLGIRPTREGLEVLPALPPTWSTAEIQRLRVRDHVVSVAVRRAPEQAGTQVTVNGAPWSDVALQRGVVLSWETLARWGGRPVEILIVQPAVVPQTVAPPVPLPADLLEPLPPRRFVVPTAEELAFRSSFDPYGLEAVAPPPVPWRSVQRP